VVHPNSSQVTDCRALKREQMDGRWLYGGGGGTPVATAHLPALLAAAMSPEELRDKDPPSAARMRAAQAALLRGLVGAVEGEGWPGGGGGGGVPTAGAEAGRQLNGGGGGCTADLEGEEGGAIGVLYSVLMRWGLLFEVGACWKERWPHQPAEDERA
jgi:hypothetical protein